MVDLVSPALKFWVCSWLGSALAKDLKFRVFDIFGSWIIALLTATLLGVTAPVRASLIAYDAAIAGDDAGGLKPLATLSSPLALTGANRGAFNFGTNSGDATIEFILQGDPSINNGSYLAVGSNANSNLRYELWNNTGELGFTQLGVMDYSFSPGVPSPTQPAHVAYVWNAAARTMQLYLNGHLAGTRSAVSANFAMPRGPGWLGANPQGGEAMVGVVYRVTVYNGRVSEEVIAGHADAFNDIVRLPAILAFTATPQTILTPASAKLDWAVRDVEAVFLNGMDVTGKSNLTVSPLVTTTYKLVATNTAGSVASQITVRVNPPPTIRRFVSNRAYAKTGDTISLTWNVDFGSEIEILPEVGDVRAQTVAGVGSIEVHPRVSTSYVLTARSDFGTNTAVVEVHIVQAADHLVISEFMAEDQSSFADENGQFSGWIEIYNPTRTPINLGGYFLTDEVASLTRWAFPNTNLPPESSLVVFASGKDRARAGAPLHTNFRLKNSGEYLALVGPGLTVVHAFSPAFPPQRPDVSYGILAGDTSLQQYFGKPTPGALNDEAPAPPLPVQFSRSNGVFIEPFTLTLNSPDLRSEIRFTLDGSTPGPTNGVVYFTPLTLTNTTRVRAVAVVDGLVSGVAGASYIKLASDIANYTSSLPIMVIENFGAGTIQRKGWNSTGANIKQVPRQLAAWATFDRVGGMAAFTNAPQMYTQIGIRGRGAYSTDWRQKPYSVEAIGEEGEEAEVSPLGMPRHADWVLYFPDPDQSRDPTLLFNTFGYEMSQNMGHYSVRFRWVEAFINEDGGELSLADRRGVYAIVEKVARGKERLDFEKLSSDGSSGSWLLNINRMDPEPDTGWPAANGATQPWYFHTGGSDRIVQTQPNTAYNPVPGFDLPQQWNAFINFENPNGYVINTNQRAAIEGWFRQFENVLYDNAAWRDPVNGYRRYLDPVDFADYFVLNVLTRNGDGLLLSMFPWKGDDGRLRMGPAWDYNWSAYYVSGGPAGSLLHRSEQLWYARLFADPDFLQLYIDRWWDLRRGPMSNVAMEAIIDRQVADIGMAKSLLNGMPSVAEWKNRISEMKTWLKQRADWIDSNYVRPPVFNREGGEVPEGFPVAISGGGGTLYVTTDGTDPRAAGGSVGFSARTYNGPMPIQAQIVLSTRILNGTNWSGLSRAYFTIPQDIASLVVTEIMYDPPAAGGWLGEEFEFLELKNVGTNTLQLGLFQFTSGIDFTFPAGVRLGAGQLFLLARNASAMQWKYPGVTVDGIYTGKLNNAGETLRLVTPASNTVFEIAYASEAPWPSGAVGGGYSVVPLLNGSPGNSSDGGYWRASSVPGGSPGHDDSMPGEVPALMIDSATITKEGLLSLSFRARSNQTYALEYTEALARGEWSKLATVKALPLDREEVIEDRPAVRSNRFYRLVTP